MRKKSDAAQTRNAPEHGRRVTRDPNAAIDVVWCQAIAASLERISRAPIQDPDLALFYTNALAHSLKEALGCEEETRLDGKRLGGCEAENGATQENETLILSKHCARLL